MCTLRGTRSFTWTWCSGPRGGHRVMSLTAIPSAHSITHGSISATSRPTKRQRAKANPTPRTDQTAGINRIAFGLRRLRSHRIQALLYAGKPNSHLLATITSR